MPGDQPSDRPFLYYIKGDKHSAAVDAGFSERCVGMFYGAAAAEGLPLPDFTLITHWHWDHTFGLPYINGLSVSSELCRRKLIEVSGWEWTRGAMDARERTGEDIPSCSENIRMEYPDLAKVKVVPTDIGITGKTVMDLGGVTLELYPMDSIHSRDAMLILCPEEKALFVGDADCEDHYENGGKADPDKARAYLAFVSGLDFEHYFLGHDVPDTKQGMIDYINSGYLKEPE